MEQTVSTINAKRKQRRELQQELEQLEQVCSKQVLANVLDTLKQEVPLLESIEATESGYGWTNVLYSYVVTFVNGVKVHAPGKAYELTVSFGDDKFTMSPHAIAKPGYVFKHKKKATRIAINEAVVAWNKLLPLLERATPNAVKRRCTELLAESE